MTLKIAVIGRHGQLATCLANSEPTGIEVRYLSRHDIDLLNPDSIKAELSGIDIVINTAAYTNVELAEVEVEQAERLNHLAVTRLAATSHQLGFRLLHISTDYVFDGRRQQPWPVNASPAPISAYGQSKYAGEQALKASAASFCIIRTSWLYADKGNNFVNTMLKLMAVKTELTVVDDQTGTPTLADNLARYIWALIQQNHWPEIVHFTDLGETTWYGFAREIQRQAIELGLLSASAICQLTPIASKDYPSRVQRPAYSALDMSQTPALTQAVQWQDALTQLLIKRLKGLRIAILKNPVPTKMANTNECWPFFVSLVSVRFGYPSPLTLLLLRRIGQKVKPKVLLFAIMNKTQGCPPHHIT